MFTLNWSVCGQSGGGSVVVASTARKEKLTKTVVNGLPLPGEGERAYWVWDTEIPGFMLAVSKSSKTFAVRRRLNGRQRYVTIGSAAAWTVEEARKQARAIIADMDRGTDHNAEKAKAKVQGITLREAVTSYVEDNAKLKPRTRKEYVEVLERNLSDWMSKPLDTISPDMVRKRYAALAERAPTQGDLTFRVFRAVFNGANALMEEAGADPLPNPCRILSRRKVWKPLVRKEGVIPVDRLGDWWQATEGMGDRLVADAFRFMLLTGWRKSEVLGLRWRDVNMKAKTVTARDTKNGTHHTLPMGEWLFRMIEARRQHAAHHDYVFQSDKGRLSNLRYFQQDVMDATGLWVTPHDLRRTFASLAADLFPELLVKKLMNHVTGNNVTLGYIIKSASDLRAPMQTIEDTILRHAGALEAGKVIQLRTA